MSDPNLDWWDERARLHLDTPVYRRHLAALDAGGVSLHEVERAALGDVRGQRLLHLQCHIGTDTLSWARLGARVTGVDFSSPALAVAAQLAERFHLDADWVEGRVDDPELDIAEGAYDWVFTSYGTITWLEDLRPWAANIARALASGGRFFFADGHPMALCLDDQRGGLRVAYPYFRGERPLVFDAPGSYADADLPTRHNRTEEWAHPVGEIVEALLGAGLVLESLGEHRACPWAITPDCVHGDDGLYRLPRPELVPLLLSITARKP